MKLISAAPKFKIQNPQSKISFWLPPLLWMGLIFYFSTDNFSGEKTGSILKTILTFIYPSLTESQFKFIHFYLRKASHFTEYAILALLLMRAFSAGFKFDWRWRWAGYTLLIVAVYALLDEFHQTFTAHRVGSIDDSLIDFSGAATAVLLLWLGNRKRSARLGA